VLGGDGFGGFSAATGTSSNLFFLQQDAYGERFFVVGSNRFEKFINGDRLIAGLEKFLQLSFGIGLFGKLFG
jgi:hypothetical protein